MRKILIWYLILVTFILALFVFSPRVQSEYNRIIQVSGEKPWGAVYVFYDTTAKVDCYVYESYTVNAGGIDCIQK